MMGSDQKVNMFPTKSKEGLGELIHSYNPLSKQIICVFFFFYITNLLCARQEVNIGVPFHVKHDVKDQNHGSTL